MLALEPAKTLIKQTDSAADSLSGRKEYSIREITSIPAPKKGTKHRGPANQCQPLLEGDPDFLATITLPYVRKRKAVLVFCPTKQGCETTATFLAKRLPFQFPEYAAEGRLDFSDLVGEFKQIVDSVVEARDQGKRLCLDAVYDRKLQEERLRLI